jgi:hypothetical protein
MEVLDVGVKPIVVQPVRVAPLPGVKAQATDALGAIPVETVADPGVQLTEAGTLPRPTTATEVVRYAKTPLPS